MEQYSQVPWFTPILLIIFLQPHHFVYSSSFSSAHDHHSCPNKQRLALFQFKQTLSIDRYASGYCDPYYGIPHSYPKTNQWNLSSDCCKWDGITCNRSTGDVIELDLNCSQLVGVLHSNSSLFHLTHLQRLNLAFNDFSGSMIPHEIGQFATSLTHLNLSFSNVSGPVPLEITHLSKLVSLDLSYNYNLILNDSNPQFQHQFPFQNLTQLRKLALAGVPIDSVIPRNLSSFSSLTYLDLSSTRLRGELPHEIFVLPNLKTLKLGYNRNLTVLPRILSSSASSLTYLDLSSTGLRGELPHEIFFLPNLKTLRLASNRDVTGVLPQSNWSTSSNRFSSTASHLRELDLSGNTMSSEVSDIVGSLKSLKSLYLAYCNLSGTIPNFISNLTHLIDLDLFGNHLEGQIPNGFANLVHLRSLLLGSNKLIIGPIPSWVANLSQLVYLDLSDSSLMGPLPSNITGLQKLTHLYLYSNSLNGTIPSWVFDLPILEYLDLSSNQLEGQLNEFPFMSNSLKHISLFGNELSGFVPQSIFQQVELRELYLSRNNLSGIIEIEMFSCLKKLESLSLSYNNLSVRLSTTNNTIINATFPNLKYLQLSSLMIKEFPYFLRAMENLRSLDLSNNQIHGRVPEWVPSKWRDSLEDLYLGSNFLEESILLWICNSTNFEFLNLSNNNFSGVLPHCLGNLSVSLSVLDLSMNHFQGTIPSTFANLNNLAYLNLHGNQFKGMVPSLGNCTSLYVIHLGGNKLKDTFPPWLETLPRLKFLILRSNEFHGPISISNISKTKYPFPELGAMDLSNNEFRGEIPNVLGTFQRLQFLDLHKNNFQGTIPSTFAKGNLLRCLNLHDNHLQGAVPSSLANCAQLEVLDLWKNQINDTFPNWLGTLPELHVLVLSLNRFHGPINTSSMTKNPFPKLRIIDLSGNEFSGLLPQLLFKNFIAMKDADENKKKAEYLGIGYYQSSVTLVMKGVTFEVERILITLTTIDLSSNKFSGEIPDVIGNLKFLRQLNLSHNSLVGRIPSLVGNLSVLESLDLNSNQLVGEIPQELANLNSLEKLNLSHNQLRGRIPSGKQFNTFMNDSYDGNLALCGFPVSDSCERSQPPVDLQQENDSDFFMDGFTWEAVLMGYVCGTVLGFVIGYIMFLVGKPKWLTGIVERELRRKVRRPQRRGYKHFGRRN